RINTPLGLKDTRIQLSAGQLTRFARAFNAKGEPTAHWDFQTLEGCGALRSTANDLLTFAAANLRLKESSLFPAMEMCHRPHPVPGDGGLRAPLGWQRAERRGTVPVILWHNGATYGAHSFLGFARETQTGVVVLSNSEEFGFDIDKVGFQALELLNPEP